MGGLFTPHTWVALVKDLYIVCGFCAFGPEQIDCHTCKNHEPDIAKQRVDRIDQIGETNKPERKCHNANHNGSHSETLSIYGEKPCGKGIQRSEEHTSELQSRFDLVCRLLLEKKN